MQPMNSTSPKYPIYNSSQIIRTMEFLRIFSIFWESCMFVTPWSINIRLYDVTHRPEYSISKDLDVIIKFATKKYPHIQFKSNQENYGIFKDIFYFLGSWLLPPDPLINPFFGVKNEPKYSKSFYISEGLSVRFEMESIVQRLCLENSDI